jgi:xylan 1,4-beta-xylosidase
MNTYHIGFNDTVPFCNNASFCVGTGRMNLALRHEYHNQLAKVQKDIGFSYIRGHGLFCDDMAVYDTYT